MALDAIIRYVRSLMAAHAPAHAHLHPRAGWGLFALSDVPMAGLTRQFPQNHMAAMGEKDVIRFLVKSLPADLFASFFKLPDLFFFRTLSQWLLVAPEASLQGGHPGKSLVFIIGMAGVAFDPLLLVFLVAKGNGLLGDRAHHKANEEEDQQKAGRQSKEEESHTESRPVRIALRIPGS